MARRIGGRVFVLGAIVQAALYTTLLTGLLGLASWARTLGNGEDWTLEQLAAMLEKEHRMLIGSVAGGLLLAVVALPFGRWAGKLIGIQKRGYGWVGPAAIFLPSLVGGGLGFVLAVMALHENIRRSALSDPWNDFVLPVAVIGGTYFLPGIFTSILSGLAVRQSLRGKVEQMQQPHP
ncbi:MAG TPA: hypothetical protein VHS96_06895 [Bacteroidia bacterium]|nr:hypothetical protein [Bacteroidia bacterium]